MNTFQRLIKNVNPETKRFVEKSYAVRKQVLHYMKQKGLNKADLARMLDKSPSEITKLLSGMHNLTLETIAKMEVCLGETIICTPIEQRDVDYFRSICVQASKVELHLEIPANAEYIPGDQLVRSIYLNAGAICSITKDDRLPA